MKILTLEKLAICCITLLISCGPAWHLKQSEKHRLIAIAKGAKVSSDTVYIEKTVQVEVPAFTDSATIAATMDEPLFHKTIKNYDSLLRASVLSTRAEESLKTKKLLEQERKKIAKGFLKDSLYHIKFDTVTFVDLAIIGGKPKLIKVVQKARTII